MRNILKSYTFKIFRNKISDIIFLILYLLGVPVITRFIIRNFFKNSAVILYCHTVLAGRENFTDLDRFYSLFGHPDRDDFEKKIKYIRNKCSPVSIKSLIENLSSTEKLPPNPVVITFDDGYMNNYSRAFQILKKYNVPSVIFLSTDFVFRKVILNHDRLMMAFYLTRETRIKIEISDKIMEFNLKKSMDRIHAINIVSGLIKQLPYDTAGKIISNIISELKIDKIDLNPVIIPLDVNTMQSMLESSLIEFGAHTKTHTILKNLPVDTAEKEIANSKTEIENNLDIDVDYFCYPNGHIDDFTEEHMEFVKKNKFKAAFSTIHGLNNKNTDRYCMFRTTFNNEPFYKFALRVSGFFELLAILKRIY